MILRLPYLCAILLALPLAAEAVTSGQHLTTAREMSDAYFGNPSDHWSFAITGTVTWCANGNIILKDKSGSCNLFNLDSDALSRGDVIAAAGHAHITQKRIPWLDYILPTKLGSEELPPLRKTLLKDCLDPSLALEGIVTEATVVDIRKDELDFRYDWLILKDGPATASAVARSTPEIQSLIGARVEVSGPVYHHVFGLRKFINPFINVELGGSIRTLTPAPKDPFDFPQLNPVGYASQSDIESLDCRTAVGRIVAVWPPNNCLLLTTERRPIRLSLATNESAPPCGSLVRAVGYPSSDVFTIWLTRARTRIEEMAEIPDDQPEFLSRPDLRPNDPKVDHLPNRLVTLDGTVKSVKVNGDGARSAELDCGGATVSVDFSANPGVFDGIEPGCVIRVTGRFIMVYERWNPSNVFPSMLDTLIVLTERPSVLQGLGWWSTGKLLVVIALLLVALLALQLRSRVLRRLARIKLNERTQLAVEIHDSLSQALTGLACHISAARNTIDTDMPVARDKLTTANQMLLSCRTELRNCLFDLRNDTLSEKDFRKAILRTLEPFEDNAAILVRFNAERSRFEDPTVHAILAIIRELVANAIRHGHAWTIRVAGVVEKGVLTFSVTDDGTGFDIEHRQNSENGHFGLDGIRERLVRLNGSISFTKPRNGGTRATVRIPLSRRTA